MGIKALNSFFSPPHSLYLSVFWVSKFAPSVELSHEADTLQEIQLNLPRTFVIITTCWVYSSQINHDGILHLGFIVALLRISRAVQPVKSSTHTRRARSTEPVAGTAGVFFSSSRGKIGLQSLRPPQQQRPTLLGLLICQLKGTNTISSQPEVAI